MRIVYYTSAPFLETALYMVRELSQAHEVHLVLQVSPESWSSGMLDARPQELSAGIVPADTILRPHFPASIVQYWENTASFSLAVFDNRKTIQPATLRTSHLVAAHIRDLAPDVLHVEEAFLRMAWGIRRLRRIPIILNVHDPEAHSGEADWRKDLARRLIFPRVDEFVVHNSRQIDLFRNRYGVPADRVSVVPLSVYDMWTTWIDPAICENSREILFFGRLSRYKGLDVLLAAAPLVAARVPHVRFVIAGRPEPGYHVPAAPALDNGGVIAVTPSYLRNSELAHCLQRTALVVCPYRDASQSAVVLTAFGFGKPVVATDVGGLSEYIDDGVTGLLVQSGDTRGLADAIVRMLEDEGLRRGMADRIRRRYSVESSWQRSAEKVVQVYQRAIAR
jgi:glycosyltransferase involved in cell wall biosynthesis